MTEKACDLTVDEINDMLGPDERPKWRGRISQRQAKLIALEARRAVEQSFIYGDRPEREQWGHSEISPIVGLQRQMNELHNRAADAAQPVRSGETQSEIQARIQREERAERIRYEQERYRQERAMAAEEHRRHYEYMLKDEWATHRPSMLGIPSEGV